MVTVESGATAVDGVTLVTVRVSGDGVARRVRVEQRLDGPVWPPRREGRPVAGWDETGYEGTVPAEGRLVLGYATPAPPDSPPVSVEEGAVVEETDAAGIADDPTAVLQRLGDPSPPRDAVSLPDSDAGTPTSTGDRAPDEPTGTDERGPERESAQTRTARDGRAADPVTAWLDRVEDRVRTVERLDAIETVPDASEAVGATGGLAACRRTTRASEADRRRLLAVAARARRLADRIESTDPPIETLERLA